MSESNEAEHFDVIVIGGGAAGLMAAASAAGRGRQTLLLEKNRKLGVKVLMSGGTRCNITHNCDAGGIVRAFGRQGRFLHSALASLSPAEVVAKIESQGVATKIEPTGKIFPVSNRAIDVRDALVALAENAGAVIRNESPVDWVARDGHPFVVSTHGQRIRCDSLVITTGGQSYPGCGTTGEGFQWAKDFGHSIVAPVPALVPILNDWSWVHSLKGVTLEHVTLTLQESPSDLSYSSQKKQRKPKTLAQRSGSFLFTHFGFSGPAPLDVSREVARRPARKTLKLVCDFLPDMKSEQLAEHLQKRKQADGKQQVAGLLGEFFPRRMSDCVLEFAGVTTSIRNAELSKSQMASIVDAIKRLPFAVQGTLGFEKAEVTAGGINLKEVDSKTMQSKLVPGLFFAGEILDLDGWIGGFNFQAAFSTGWLAGQNV